MKLAIIGMGKMGSNMARRLLRASHECLVFDENQAKANDVIKAGGVAIENLKELKVQIPSPRIVWMMLPAGEATESTVQQLAEILEAGDILIDGGNSYFKDDVRRADFLKSRLIHYLDVGVSGGIWGLERGYCLMIGGNSKVVQYLDPIFHTLSPGQNRVSVSHSHQENESTAERGYLYCGPSGSGHYVKMIHNGIEYGMMQSLAEGFHLLQSASTEALPLPYRYHFKIAEISELWRRGSVISSWLLDLIANSLNQDSTLSKFEGRVEDSGEGRWTVQAALEQAIPAEVLTTALFIRFRSREPRSFAEKLLSAMRNQFGGHLEQKKAA